MIITQNSPINFVHTLPDEQPIRVAHVIGKAVNAGVEAVVMNYYRHIDRSRYQFDLIVDADSTYSWDEEVNTLGGRIYTVAPYQNFFQNQKDLISLFRKNQYKIVHSHLNTLSVFSLMAAQRAGVPIRIAHSLSTAGKGEFKRNCLKNILRPFSKIFSTHYCACSEYAATWLFGERCFKEGKIKILRNAIDTKKFIFNPRVREQIRKQYRIENRFVIGHIGRFNKQKNHDFLIDIFAEIRRIRSDSTLLLIGDGPLLPRIQAKVEHLNLTKDVIFAGMQKETKSFYQAMDIFLFPSLYEGLPVVGVEAQASGLRIITSTDVSQETMITNQVRFLPLDLPPSVWAKEVAEFGLMYSRNNSQKDMIRAGYDISNEAVHLENFYLECLSEKNAINSI